LIDDKSPYYKYTPANVLENENFKQKTELKDNNKFIVFSKAQKYVFFMFVPCINDD